MKKYIYVISFLALILNACKSENKANEEAQKTADEAFPETEVVLSKSEQIVTDEFAKEYSAVLDQYFELKDALVETDSVNSIKNAKLLIAKFDAVKTNDLPDSSANYWKEQTDIIELILQKIISAQSIKHQRTEFYALSEDIFELYKKLGLKEKVVYKQFCPMAFDDKGAFWLSNSDDILNPYFGSEMLHCGEVQEKIQN